MGTLRNEISPGIGVGIGIAVGFETRSNTDCDPEARRVFGLKSKV
jgi:hypothetical protein